MAASIALTLDVDKCLFASSFFFFLSLSLARTEICMHFVMQQLHIASQTAQPNFFLPCMCVYASGTRKNANVMLCIIIQE